MISYVIGSSAAATVLQLRPNHVTVIPEAVKASLRVPIYIPRMLPRKRLVAAFHAIHPSTTPHPKRRILPEQAATFIMFLAFVQWHGRDGSRWAASRERHLYDAFESLTSKVPPTART